MLRFSFDMCRNFEGDTNCNANTFTSFVSYAAHVCLTERSKKGNKPAFSFECSSGKWCFRPVLRKVQLWISGVFKACTIILLLQMQRQCAWTWTWTANPTALDLSCHSLFQTLANWTLVVMTTMMMIMEQNTSLTLSWSRPLLSPLILSRVHSESPASPARNRFRLKLLSR